MLLTLPAEIQTEICKYLPRRDLASVAHVCSNLSAVAVRILYEHVELHSFNQVEAFFHIGASPVAVKGSDTKRTQWERIKTLAITIAPDDSQRSLAKLPASLERPGVDPLKLARLRLTCKEDADCLVPLLNCFRPTEIGLCWVADLLCWQDPRWLSITGWDNVRSITTLCSPPAQTAFSFETNLDRIPFDPPFSHATSAVIRLPTYISGWVLALVFQADLLVRLCPDLPGIEIQVDKERNRLHLQECVMGGWFGKPLGGKPASFYSIVVKPEGCNIWGDVEEGDA